MCGASYSSGHAPSGETELVHYMDHRNTYLGLWSSMPGSKMQGQILLERERQSHVRRNPHRYATRSKVTRASQSGRPWAFWDMSPACRTDWHEAESYKEWSIVDGQFDARGTQRWSRWERLWRSTADRSAPIRARRLTSGAFAGALAVAGIAHGRTRALDGQTPSSSGCGARSSARCRYARRWVAAACPGAAVVDSAHVCG